jgi:hypothetical protein
MANLIRLKQIEGSEQLQSAISAGEAIGTGSFATAVDSAVSQSLQTSLSASIINIILNNVGAVLPNGVVSGSSQIYISGTIGYNELATDLEVAVVSGSIATTIGIIASGSGFVTTASFHSYTASLGNTFATDQEVYLTASAIIDQGEF